VAQRSITVASQAQQGILETELLLFPRSWLAGRQDLALRSRLLKRSFAAAAKADVRWRRPAWSEAGAVGKAQVPKFPFTRGQASADFTQGLGVPQLTKKHGNELTPATETTA